MARRQDDELFDALSAPLGDVISSVARGVADAQQALDMRTIETYKEIYGENAGLKAELQLLGYKPTWYIIPEVTVEVVMSLSISENTDVHGSAQLNLGRDKLPLKIYAVPIDANYSNRYNYDVKGASKITFKIVPVPPSPQAEQIRVTPNVVNKTMKDAGELLRLLDINFSANKKKPGDDERIVRTKPEAGALLKAGQKLLLYLE